MQNYATIIGVISLRERKVSYEYVQARYNIGSWTVQNIMKRYRINSIPLEELQNMPAEEVEEMFYPPSNKLRKAEWMPDYEAIYDLMHDPVSHADLLQIWKEYKKDNPDGYQYTQFAEHYRRYEEEHGIVKDVSMAVNRIPGERVFIDWGGDKPLCVIDQETGELLEAHLLVTTVGVSSKVYAEAFPEEKQISFNTGVVNALESYGASPRYLVPDNLKTAVTKHTKDELIINASFQDLESFYDVIVLPPPARKPKGKPTAEKYVQYIQNTIFSAVYGKVFQNFSELNQLIREKVAVINEETPGDWGKSHNELFELYDKPQMKPLSHGRFTICDYVSFERVPDNYHLKYDNHYYSIFYTYFNKPVVLKATMTKIVICDRNNRFVCEHERAYKPFPKYITKDEHMPANHRFAKEVSERDGDYYRRWAGGISNDLWVVIDRILHSVKHEEQMYNSCNGILHSCDGVPRHVIEKTARACIDSNTCNYTSFKRYLKDYKNQDNIEVNKQSENANLPEHRNLWGKDYYK